MVKGWLIGYFQFILYHIIRCNALIYCNVPLTRLSMCCFLSMLSASEKFGDATFMSTVSCLILSNVSFGAIGITESCVDCDKLKDGALPTLFGVM